MIKLRMDVDYPYPSRFHSFVATALNIKKPGRNYLQNSKILARMINESPKELKAYWFFTPYTIPDSELLALLNPDRHEVALHVAREPYSELECLERATQRKVKYYTIHGTARVVAQLMWRRKLHQKVVPIPKGFPLIFFYDFPTLNFDWICNHNPMQKAIEIAEASIAKGDILHMHPEWLFQSGGRLNHRGPYYDALKIILQTDTDLTELVTRKKCFAKLSSFWGANEYMKDHVPKTDFLQKLTERGTDIYSFIERKWCCPVPNPPKNWIKTQENVAMLHLNTYKEWWEGISKKTRNMVRKSEKSGVTTAVSEPNEALAEGIWKIYNETPIRQGRPFPHYGMPLESLKFSIPLVRDSTYVGAYYQNELIGFIQLTHGNNIAAIAQILAYQKHMDKAVNNALIARAIEVCAEKNIQWILYGRMGNHPSLDSFKENNLFQNFSLTRYYVPLTRKGRLTAALGLHKDLKDTLPPWIKGPLFPIYNWVSRAKRNLWLLMHPK
jgi:hypothetical protein